ncbi:MAG: Virulence factor BrkB [Chloroflexi bacterium]|nr:Virulence factor BrkB [Chloroflexota bacterium]
MIARLGAVRDRVMARVETMRRRTLAIALVRLLLAVLAVYNRAGGGLLTAGLAYRVLVTLLPGLALVVGFVGVVVSDPATQEEIAEAIVDAFPPLEPIIGDALLALASGAVPLSLLGLVGLAWASSALYGTLDNAIARVFAGAPARDVVQRRLLGVLLVALALGLVAALLVVATLAGVIMAALGVSGAGAVPTTLATLGGLLAPVALTILVYATLPRRKLPVRAVLAAGLVAGLLISGFTAIFEFIAPRLVGGSLALFGSFVALFAALIWLSIVVQILLLGAAWLQVTTRISPRGIEAGPDLDGPAGRPIVG